MSGQVGLLFQGLLLAPLPRLVTDYATRHPYGKGKTEAGRKRSLWKRLFHQLEGAGGASRPLLGDHLARHQPLPRRKIHSRGHARTRAYGCARAELPAEFDGAVFAAET